MFAMPTYPNMYVSNTYSLELETSCLESLGTTGKMKENDKMLSHIVQLAFLWIGANFVFPHLYFFYVSSFLSSILPPPLLPFLLFLTSSWSFSTLTIIFCFLSPPNSFRSLYYPPGFPSLSHHFCLFPLIFSLHILLFHLLLFLLHFLFIHLIILCFSLSLFPSISFHFLFFPSPLPIHESLSISLSSSFLSLLFTSSFYTYYYHSSRYFSYPTHSFFSLIFHMFRFSNGTPVRLGISKRNNVIL